MRWAELDPATRPFDLEAARAEITRLVVEADGRERLVADVNKALVATYGDWASGWRSTPGVWCCTEHSALRAGEPRERTTERVLAAIAAWRRFLDALAARFATVDTTDLVLEEIVERAAAALLPIVVEHTRTDDAWYATFVDAVAWYLEAAGHGEATDTIEQVVSGSFESWAEPAPAVAAQTLRVLGREVAAALGDSTLRDSLRDWQAVRTRVFAPALAWSVGPPTGDGHQRFIDEVDAARDRVRAERMSAALVLARDAAARGTPLTFDQLAECQAIVLGGPAALRTGDAYAKGGRERYGWRPDLAERFATCLAEASSNAEPVCIRAARVYLDVCFFHPFADGNARAARIALDYVLTAAGLGLANAEPLFVVSRAADDVEGAMLFAEALSRLAGVRG